MSTVYLSKPNGSGGCGCCQKLCVCFSGIWSPDSFSHGNPVNVYLNGNLIATFLDTDENVWEICGIPVKGTNHILFDGERGFEWIDSCNGNWKVNFDNSGWVKTGYEANFDYESIE